MTNALRSLETLRADAVEKARTALAHERLVLAQAESLVTEAAQRVEEASLRVRRASEVPALTTAADFAWAERAKRAERLQHARFVTRLEVAEAQRAHAKARVEAAEQLVIDAEVERRAVGQVVAKRDALIERQREQRSEEDAADAHRARPR